MQSMSLRDATKSLKMRAVDGKPLGIARRNFLQMIKGEAGQHFRLVRLVDPEQVVEAPHPFRECRLSQNPAAAQATQAIDLRQAAGDDELRSEVRRRLLRRYGTVQIDLVDQHMGAASLGNRANRAKIVFAGQRAAGVVQVGDDDEPRTVWTQRFPAGRCPAGSHSPACRSSHLMSAPRNRAEESIGS